MSIDRAIELLKLEYESAKHNPYIINPLAYAFYKIWKIVDKERR